MIFADFLKANKAQIRKLSDSNVKKLDGVPVISPDDEWVRESEWDMFYDELSNKGKGKGNSGV